MMMIMVNTVQHFYFSLVFYFTFYLVCLDYSIFIKLKRVSEEPIVERRVGLFSAPSDSISLDNGALSVHPNES